MYTQAFTYLMLQIHGTWTEGEANKKVNNNNLSFWNLNIFDQLYDPSLSEHKMLLIFKASVWNVGTKK